MLRNDTVKCPTRAGAGETPLPSVEVAPKRVCCVLDVVNIFGTFGDEIP